MSRSKQGAAVAAAALCGLIGPARPAAACDCVYVEPCTITTDLADMVGAPEHTMCTVRGTSGSYAVAYTLTTPRGDRYRIENPITWFDGWFINAQPGVRVATADPAHPCFRTPRVQICLGQ